MANLPPNAPALPITDADVKSVPPPVQPAIAKIGSDINGLQKQIDTLANAAAAKAQAIQAGTSALAHGLKGGTVKFPQKFGTIPSVVLTPWFGPPGSPTPNAAANQTAQYVCLTSISKESFSFMCFPDVPVLGPDPSYPVQVSWIAVG